MNDKKRSGGLFSLLARNYLLFAVTLLLITGGVYLLWNARMDQLFASTDIDAMLADPALANADYAKLKKNVADTDAFAVTDKAGNMLYQSGALPKEYEQEKQAFTASDGTARILLVYYGIWNENSWQQKYQLSLQVWLLLLPLSLAAIGLFILWLDRRIRKPLDTLNAAILAQADGRPARAGDIRGPEEIRRIGESFDKLTDQLEASEAERRKLDEGRQKLIADISHDLKTPISVISGYADAICDGKTAPEETEHYLRAVRSKADALTALINEFHEYSKTEHPDFILHTERTDICEFMREYLAEKYDEIELAGFSLSIHIPERSCFCMLDGFQFRRALDNLLSNSLRHNRLGTLLFFELDTVDSVIRLAIADNGEGIPKEKQAAIFEPFVTGDDARSGGGSGLGLAITKRIIEKHGGVIRLTSRPAAGKSTEFVIELPEANS